MTATDHTESIDRDEIERFAALSSRWWDPDGPMRPLHRLNPTRLTWIRDEICRHFGRDARKMPALEGLSVLDIGCGAGLVSEPLARMGADVTGIDPAGENIAVARQHAESGGLAIDYRSTEAERLAADGETFDVVMVLEVVEHVTSVPEFVATCASMVRPGGLLIASTINRTAKAFLLAIVGAEYVMRWLPRGTHAYDKLVTPDELEAALTAPGLHMVGRTGVMFVPIADEWRLAPNDLDVNYMLSATRPG